MPAGLGSANLIITDKRSDGYVEKHAWGLDFPMSNLDRTARADGITANAARHFPEWALTNIHPIPELAAAILACHAGSSSLSLTGWTIEASGLWKAVTPVGRRLTWLKCYDGRIDQTGGIRSISVLPKNPTWRFSFLRSQPPGNQATPQTYPVEFAVTLNALGAIQYQLYIPQLWDESSSVYPDAYIPTLYKSTDSGATWTPVDALASEEASRWAAGAFERFEFIYCRFIRDHLIFSLGDSSSHWIYHEQGLEIPQGHVRIECGGGHFAFHIKHAVYMDTGVIERNIGIVPPDYINPVADSMDYLGDPGDAGGFSVTMESGGSPTQYWPKATLISSPDPAFGQRLYTPVLYEVQATRPATHSAPITTVIFDNEAIPADKGRLLSCEFTIAQDWRGSSFSAQLRTATGSDEYNLSGNEKAALKVALDAGAGVSWVHQLTGYLETPTYSLLPDDPGQMIIHLAAHDRIVRLRNKCVGPLPSFAGWTAAAAFAWLFHEVAGIPDADILIDADAYDWLYPCPFSWLILKFDATATVVDIADELAKAAGRRWGIDQLGRVFTRLDLADVYGGTPDFILDTAAVSDQDKLYFVEFDRDLFAVRNRIICIGNDADGAEVMASFRFDGSLSDPTADPFIGDDWCQVVIGPDGLNPWVYAQIKGAELLKCRGILCWETDGKPTLFPDHFVEVQVPGIGVPPGAVFQILEKHGQITSDGAFTTRFAGVVI